MDIFFSEIFMFFSCKKSKSIKIYLYQILYIVLCALYLNLIPKKENVIIFLIMTVIFSIVTMFTTAISTNFEYFSKLLLKKKHKGLLKKIYKKNYNIYYLLSKEFCNIILIFLSLLTGFLINENVNILIIYILTLILIDFICYLLIYFYIKK